MKVIARLYSTFGKGEGEELYEEYVIEDNPEGRLRLLKDEGFNYDGYNGLLQVEIDKFVNGEINELYKDNSGGDWDEPTGLSLLVISKEEALAQAAAAYQVEIKIIEKLFEK